MKDTSQGSHEYFKQLTKRVGTGLILGGIAILVLFFSLNLLAAYFVIPILVMLLGAFVGAMTGLQKSLKDELYDDWPLWAVFAVCSFGLGISESHSFMSGLWLVAVVLWIRHFTGIAMFFAKRVGRYVEPRYLAWRARRKKTV